MRPEHLVFEDLRDDGVDGFYGHLRKLADGYERDKLANQPIEVSDPWAFALGERAIFALPTGEPLLLAAPYPSPT